jgi:hypothetical protein
MNGIWEFFKLSLQCIYLLQAGKQDAKAKICERILYKSILVYAPYLFQTN